MFDITVFYLHYPHSVFDPRVSGGRKRKSKGDERKIIFSHLSHVNVEKLVHLMDSKSS